MPIAKTHTDILKDIRAKSFKPIYLVHGEEPYFADVLAKAFETQAIDAASRGFNQTVLYGRDTSAGQIVDAASRYPMMATHQLVLVKEAQDLADIKQLAQYCAKPVPSTILVFAHRGKKLNKATKVYKAILQNGVVFESKPLYANKVPAFVNTWAKQHKRTLESGVAETLAEYLGTDLVVLDGALEKLLLNVPQERAVTAEDVEAHVGISRQFNVFELQDALGAKDFDRVVRIGYGLARNERENPLPMTIASLYGFFAGMFAIKDIVRGSEQDQKEATGIFSPFRLGKVRQAATRWGKGQLMQGILVLEEYDLKFKGVEYNASIGGGEQLTLELVQRLVGVGAGR